MKEFFVDAYQKKDVENPAFCYKSGMTVYEEGFDANMLSSLGWNGAGFTLNILDGMPTYLTQSEFRYSEVFRVDVNGASATYSWKLCGFETKKDERGFLHAVLSLRSSRAPLFAKVHTLLDGTAILTRWIELENTGDAPMNLSNLRIMGGGLDRIKKWREYTDDRGLEKLWSIGYFERTQWGTEGAFRWHDLGSARMTVKGHYDNNKHRHPMAMVRNNALGTLFFAQLGFSGGWAFDFEMNADNSENACLSFAVRLDGENPTYILSAGETLETPKVHIGMMNASLDDIVNEMHEHTRKTVFTYPEDDRVRGGLLESGIGPEHSMTVQATKDFIDICAATGAEAFIIDAGWYCPLGTETKDWKNRAGDWVADPERYPNGIAEIREYVHSKGMLFGMWAAIEEGGVLSKIYEEHPDWFAHFMSGTRTIALDLTKDEVIDYIEKSFSRLVEEYGIDIFRIDLNIAPFLSHYLNARGENGNLRRYLNFYALLGRLRRRYPHVIFENCAGGGGRTDLGLMEHFSHTWVSDYQIAPRSVQITNGMTMVLPPERVDRLASGMDSHTTGTLDMNIRHTLFGRPTTNNYNCVGTAMNPNQIDFVRHSFDIYKNVIRPFAPTGKIFHHTPESYEMQPERTLVLERAAADGSAGVIGVFRLAGKSDEVTTVYPRGLDLSAEYEVTFDNCASSVRLRGYEMKNAGVRVSIGANLSSELIIYKKI